MTVRVTAVDQPQLTPLEMPDRFRHEIAYFMTPAGAPGVPELAPGEYWVRKSEALEWYEGGVFHLVSPLDSQNQTECELSEEQEMWLAWMVEHGIERVKLV